MTGYEMVLLARAVEECEAADCTFGVRRMKTGRVVCALTRYLQPVEYFGGETLAVALTALLRDLGVEVPEPPSAELVQHARQHIEDYTVDGAETVLDVLRTLGPQTVIALLEGGAS